ncbi:MAG: hypothetical protein Q9196_001904, partial [Gyalolechia fulgens]
LVEFGIRGHFAAYPRWEPYAHLGHGGPPPCELRVRIHSARDRDGDEGGYGHSVQQEENESWK